MEKNDTYAKIFHKICDEDDHRYISERIPEFHTIMRKSKLCILNPKKVKKLDNKTKERKGHLGNSKPKLLDEQMLKKCNNPSTKRLFQSNSYCANSNSCSGVEFSCGISGDDVFDETERSSDTIPDSLMVNNNAKCSSSDIDLYKSASLCIQYPLFSKQRAIFGHESTAHVVSEKDRDSYQLNKCLQDIFYPLTLSQHREFQASLYHAFDKEQHIRKLVNIQLFAQLQQLEKNECYYYTKDDFQTNEEYIYWKREESLVLHRLLGKDFSSMIPQDCTRNRIEDYECLLMKILRYHTGYNHIKCSSVNSALSQSETKISDTSSQDIKRLQKMYPPEAEWLLNEFATLYRVNPVTQQVIFLNCIIKCCDDEVLKIGDLAVLKQCQHQLRNLNSLVFQSTYKHVILVSEIHTLLNTTGRIIGYIKQLLCSFISAGDPAGPDLLAACLTLLKSCHDFTVHFDKDFTEDNDSCVVNWLKLAIKDCYNARTHPFDKCESASQVLFLLKAVRSCIHILSDGSKKGYQALFDSLPNCKLAIASVLYDCVINDVSLLTRYQLGEKEFQASIDLTYRLLEFEKIVLNLGVILDNSSHKLSWRDVFYKQSLTWVEIFSSRLSQCVLMCVHCNRPFEPWLQQLLLDNDTEAERSSGNSNDCIISCVDDTELLGEAASFVTQDKTKTANDSKYLLLGRMRLNTFVSHTNDDAEQTSESVTETTLIFRNLEGNLKYNSNYPECSHSALLVIIMLNRFLKFIEEIIGNVYLLPKPLKNKSRDVHKERFSNDVSKVLSSVMIQYCDAILNMDLCLFPKASLNQFVKNVKHQELKERARNGTVNCCRHQLANGINPCYDEIKKTKWFEANSVYHEMARRINDASLICGSVYAIWDRLAASLDISGLDNFLPNFSPESFHSITHCSHTDTGKRHSTSFNVAMMDTGEVNPGGTDIDVSSDPDELHNKYFIKECQKDNIINKSLSTIGNDETMIPPLSNLNTSLTRDQLSKKMRKTSPHKFRGEDFEKKSNLTNEKLSYITRILVDARSRTLESCEDSRRSLCGIWGYRIAQHLCDILTRTYENFNFDFKLTRTSMLKDIDICKLHCKPLLNAVECALIISSSWLLEDSIVIAQEAMWSELIMGFREAVKRLQEDTHSFRSRSFLLITIFQNLLKSFSVDGILDLNIISHDVPSILSVLELFMAPSSKVIDMHQYFEVLEKQNGLELTIIRNLCCEQKSFTGQQLLNKVNKLLRSQYNDTIEIPDGNAFCNDMMVKGLIKPIIVRNKLSPLPELVTWHEISTSSGESTTYCSTNNTPSNSANSSAMSSLPESDCESDTNTFVADSSHYYTLSSDYLPLFYFNDPHGNHLKPQFLKKILLSRKNNDPVARYYLRKRYKQRSWLDVCGCLS